MLIPLLFALLAVTPYQDRTFQSRVFGQERHYRLFLPAGYEKGTDRYPVIYYFHGHSDRYTLERYDDGKDTVPKIARFIATHPVIVVSVNGYVAERFEEQKQREWTSARELTSVVRLSPQTPAATEIPIVLMNESWSFHFTPDVRYGTEPLYQAYRFHRNHVFSWTLKVRARE